MEEDVDGLLITKGVSGNACEGFKLGYVVVDFGVFHFEFGQIVSGSLLALTISELIEELGLKGLPDVGYVLSNWIQGIDPRSYSSGPLGNFGSVHECECQGHFTNW